jgi:hypothetical protein
LAVPVEKDQSSRLLSWILPEPPMVLVAEVVGQEAATEIRHPEALPR